MEDFSQAVIALVTLRATPTVYLVHAAMLCYAGGFLFRSQIKLRLLVLAGTGLYTAYYWLHPAVPLWDAIFASFVIGVANVVGLCALTLDRLPVAMGPARTLRDAFEALAPGVINPGRVRGLARLGATTAVPDTTLLLREGLNPGALHFILEGEARLYKDGQAHHIQAPCFVGEIAFVTGDTASADVTVLEGSTLMSWPSLGLRQAMAASGELDRSLRALISYDLARKLAVSVPTAIPSFEGANVSEEPGTCSPHPIEPDTQRPFQTRTEPHEGNRPLRIV